MIVIMHFGDGNFTEIEVDLDPDETAEDALQKARDYVRDNSWFQIENEIGTSSELPL